jgi:hypothetical protein
MIAFLRFNQLLISRECGEMIDISIDSDSNFITDTRKWYRHSLVDIWSSGNSVTGVTVYFHG